MQEPVSERDFEREADAVLHAIEGALSDVAGLEIEISGGILTVEFGDGTRFVINSHRAAREIWMAADLHAWHFGFASRDRLWIAGKTGEELWTTVEAVIAQKLGRPLKLPRTA